MIVITCKVANISGTVVGDQKICKNYKVIIRCTSGKFFANTNNGTKELFLLYTKDLQGDTVRYETPSMLFKFSNFLSKNFGY